ncbi:DUF998 domain-containing protein [Streptomyces sp. CC228A]|uniref:DUF998 domain-containing protein n=1 Tax=Streptomyces sp. CC228A TaxID=2898186 RepID=UPI0027E4F431|nr:DUF998 domain-containing protein [Streptomyces sp. CC228A]
MTPPPRGRGPVRWPLAVLLALGAVTYSAWLLETVLGTGLDPVQSYVSELAATDQRLGGLFRTTDLVSGVLVLTAALGALAGSERRPLTVAGWVALALFGAATAADSRLPLSCTPTADAACAAREDAGDVPFTHLAHAVSSSLAMAGALAGVAALTLAARRYGHWPAVARTGSVLAVAAAAATVWTLAGVAAFEAERGHWGLGAGQRLQVLLVAAWLLVLAWSLTRRPPGPDRAPGTGRGRGAAGTGGPGRGRGARSAPGGRSAGRAGDAGSPGFRRAVGIHGRRAAVARPGPRTRRAVCFRVRRGPAPGSAWRPTAVEAKGAPGTAEATAAVEPPPPAQVRGPAGPPVSAAAEPAETPAEGRAGPPATSSPSPRRPSGPRGARLRRPAGAGLP